MALTGVLTWQQVVALKGPVWLFMRSGAPAGQPSGMARRGEAGVGRRGGDGVMRAGGAGPDNSHSARVVAARCQRTGNDTCSPKTLRGVTVQVARPEVQRQIDRKSYSLANDQQAATGSLADVLRNLPSVDVDPQGQVSIRGDANVTILVDGQPSPLFQGPGRAQLLQQLPANAYDRVEVMTNPSAAFRPEGTGGIINLISKKRSKPGREGTLSAKAVSTDGLNANARGLCDTHTDVPGRCSPCATGTSETPCRHVIWSIPRRARSPMSG